VEWARYIDAYCERTDPDLWAEPLNAISNLAFLIAAWVMWRRLRGAGLPLAQLLVGVLAVIGVSSALWHTLALGWAGAADSGSILVFIVIYVYAANRHYLGWPVWAAGLGTLAFVAYVQAGTMLFALLPFFRISAFYWPVPVAILIYAVVLRAGAPQTARGLVIGAGILNASLVFRSLDTPLCTSLPIGTHVLWHLLNAAMLGWMIEVYRRHMLAGLREGR